MLPPLPVPTIPGADAVAAWFTMWPSFHDAEVLSFHLNRGATSLIRVHAWIVSSRTDDRGFFIKEREGIVRFELRGIKWLSLEGEDADRQNVIQSLALEQTPDGWKIELVPCYGVSGEIVAEHVSVRIEREGPPDGQEQLHPSK